MKLTISEDYFRYAEFNHPNKLVSNGHRMYLNIQGVRLVDPKRFQYFYTKNIINHK